MQLGDCEETVVICNGSDNSNCLVLVGLLGGLGLCLGDNARNRDGRTVDARLKKALENDFVEVGVGATYALENCQILFAFLVSPPHMICKDAVKSREG